MMPPLLLQARLKCNPFVNGFNTVPERMTMTARVVYLAHSLTTI
jgi:hypothetical protein